MVEIDLKKIEEKWKKYWEKERIYKVDFNSKKKIFSIDTPPPYISGRMHIGHAFSYSQQDFIVRFQRMLNGNVFYPFGTDDNGLPSERFIERINNVKSKNMSRAEFIELCLKTLKKETPICIEDFKDLGISADFDIYYSTIDKHSQKISQKSFVDLLKKKQIYSKKFPTPWCPECQTSVAQAELEDKQEKTLFSTIKFSCLEKELLISTTRPELLGACVAVFVNSKDKRYKFLIGKKAKVPLFEFDVPIIADDSTDMEKGTGVMMVCSYGDKYDVDTINRHKLVPKIIIEKNGVLNFGNYSGLKIKSAREQILKDLKSKNLIKEQKEIEHIVNCHDKCGTEIEFLETEQWFIKILDKKKELIGQGKKIKWYPEFMFKRYENWINGLEWDWSISRDRHFGVPIPIWKCECGKIIVPEEKELPVDPLQTKKICPKCKNQAIGETRVFDTWATSSMTPQIASELIGGKIKIPFSLRPQAHDIIRTWAFYTIVKSYLHEKKIPWKDIIISGFVKLGGEKMSKSKGTGIDPKKVLQEYGADVLRFWASSSKLGNDLDYQEQDLISGKKLITKLINASNFVFMNLKDFDGKRPKEIERLDELFLEKLNYLISTITKRFESYDYSSSKNKIEQFFWKDFCDNYLEIVKKRVYSEEGNKRKSAQYVLYRILFAILKMFAPIMPFITEEIYQEHFRGFEKEKSIHVSGWPKKVDGFKESIVNDFDFFVDLLNKVRTEKTRMQKSMNADCIIYMPEKNKRALLKMLDDFKNVTNAKEIKESKEFKVEF
jgi:valyl-tRNA synthetase